MAFGLTRREHSTCDARRRAIAETNAFLSWALSAERDLPRIPRRRVDRGGFGQLLKRPGSATIVAYWWAKALDRVRER